MKVGLINKIITYILLTWVHLIISIRFIAAFYGCVLCQSSSMTVYPVLSLLPSFSLPDVLCDPTDLIWMKGTPFEAMTGRTVPSSDGLLAEGFWGFPRP